MHDNINSVQYPDILLILGTDASGKNYVTNFIADILEKSDRDFEKRDGWFSNKAADIISSEDKSRTDLLKEKIFLSTFHLTSFFMPLLINFLIKMDLRKFKRTDKIIIVISHTGFRILAFYLGHMYDCKESIKLPHYLDRTLRSVITVTRSKTIVLDIADKVRQNRIAKRVTTGKADNFDKYMAKDNIRSERIESFLVWLAETYLNAVKIENDDLNDKELSLQIYRAFYEFQKQAGGKRLRG
ncbi:MAG: hypothetical protein GY749_20225 [Desulfobacteraceae bacterium]|nr:hypothetical protein [Desulfobacteraceae bacterium]